MKSLSPAWKWFGLGSAIGCVLAVLATYHLVSGRLAQMGGDPELALPPVMIVATSIMTFFGVLVPILALLGVVVVIVDGYSRGRKTG